MYRATFGRRQFCREIGECLGQIVTASKTRPKDKGQEELSMVSPELRPDYINATITFEGLSRKLKKSSKSVHRMLGPRGNPRAENIIEIIKILQAHERVTLQVKVKRAA